MSRTRPDIAVPERTRVGWIGTGVMGASMCGHILDAGFDVTVHTRTRHKADPLLDRGATWADGPRQVAEDADVVCVMVGVPADVRAVVLAEGGVLSGLGPGGVVVDLTTSEPALAEEIAAAAAATDGWAVDAPVSGGDVGARDGRLSVMAGGDTDAVTAVRPVLDTFAAAVVHQGGPGAGQHTKMVNQTLVAAGMVGVCEALVYAHRSGLDVSTVLESVTAGAAGSWALANLGPRMIAGDYAPGFFVDHFVKDLGIVAAEADRMGLDLPGLALAHRLYADLQAAGHGRDGTQALIAAVAAASKVDWP